MNKILGTIAALALVVGIPLTGSAQSTNLSVTGSAILGQGLNLSGSCGAVASGNTANISLVRSSGAINLGSTTTDSSGNFSGTFAVPSNIGGGPVTIQAACPNGPVTLNSSIIDPSAVFNSADSSPAIGSAFTVNGVCGINGGGNVSFTLSNPTTQVILGSTTTASNGSYSAVLSVPTGFPTGSALLVATCPTGNVIMRSVTVDPATTGGTVTLPPEDEGVGGVDDEDTTPEGGVAAGANSTGLMLSAILVSAGIAGLLVSRMQRKFTDDPGAGR